MAEITVKMTAVDYMYMCENGGEWAETFGQQTDEELADRFQNETNPGQVPGRHWKRFDAIGGDRTKLRFARSFLDAMCIPYEIVYDAYTWDNGEEIGWDILSDYDNYNDPVVAEDRRVSQLFHAQGSGDELLKQYLMPSAEKGEKHSE
ncbi:hypothetical protein ACWDFH_23975 [Streptomyces kronopolitis]